MDHGKGPELCDFNRIELPVPRLNLIKLVFKRTFLSHDETIFLKALLWRAESANNKILHVMSLAEKALLKSGASS